MVSAAAVNTQYNVHCMYLALLSAIQYIPLTRTYFFAAILGLEELEPDVTDDQPAITFDQPNRRWVTYGVLEVYDSVVLQHFLHLLADEVTVIVAVDDSGAIKRPEKPC
jgi:hypothetical protein